MIFLFSFFFFSFVRSCFIIVLMCIIVVVICGVFGLVLCFGLFGDLKYSVMRFGCLCEGKFRYFSIVFMWFL